MSSFQSTRPIRGATTAETAKAGTTQFQSTRPIRGATSSIRAGDSGPGYFNPRAPYGARPHDRSNLIERSNISIHAPHTGRDPPFRSIVLYFGKISIHAPHTGRDHRFTRDAYTALLFQSTRPIRGATTYMKAVGTRELISIHAPHTGRDCEILFVTVIALYFNPRAPYGARPTIPKHCSLLRQDFNPRAPYGARRPFGRSVYQRYKFQSTRPIRGATED